MVRRRIAGGEPNEAVDAYRAGVARERPRDPLAVGGDRNVVDGEPPFTADDARTAASVHTQVAELIRDALFGPVRTTARPGFGPAVIVVDAADRVISLTPAAPARIEELGGWDNRSLPSPVLVTTAVARSAAELAVNRAVGRGGAWLVVRATTFAVPSEAGATARGDDVVITIDVASPSDISELHLAARGLSPREQQVAALVLQGAATKAIAASLFLSPHTVQDHLKSIFVKLEVNSRREMVAKLVSA